MNLIDIITILFFSAGVVIMGLLFSKKGKNMKSFFAAGGAVPWQLSGLSLFMGFHSAGTFVVWGSIAYQLGWVSISIQWTMAIAGFLVGTFIASRWHKTGSLTAAEYITNRLGLNTQKTYTYLFLFISLFTTGAFLYPVAKIVEVSTGLPLDASILLIGGLCVLYVSVGGLWAVMSTDVLQFIILTVAVIILIPLSFDKVGGVTAFINSAPDTFFNILNGDFTLGFIIAFGIYNAIFLGGNWAYIQRYTSVSTPQNAKKVGLMFGALYLISPVMWMLPPMIYRIMNPGLEGLEAEGAYLLICKEVLPSGVLGLMLAGMVFATASAMNATLNISSGVITNDIFKRWRPLSSNKTLMRVARISTICIGVLAIVVALMIKNMGGIVNVVISIAALTGVPLYLPVIWTLFSKRQTKISVLTTTLLSLATNAFFKFLAPLLFNFSFNRSAEMIFGVTFPIVCLLFFEVYYKCRNQISPLYTPYKKWEHQNEQNRNSLTDEELQAAKEENRFSAKVIGSGVMFTGIGISILGILSTTANLFVIIMGLLLILFGFYLRNKNTVKK